MKMYNPTMEMATAVMNAYANKDYDENGTFRVSGNGLTIELWNGVSGVITAHVETAFGMNAYVHDVTYISIESHPNLKLCFHGNGNISIPVTLD